MYIPPAAQTSSFSKPFPGYFLDINYISLVDIVVVFIVKVTFKNVTDLTLAILLV